MERQIIIEIRYDPATKMLWRRDGSKPECLGQLNTLKGRLTREQKLRAIQADGEWVKL